jgi:hypothetical protein
MFALRKQTADGKNQCSCDAKARIMALMVAVDEK